MRTLIESTLLIFILSSVHAQQFSAEARLSKVINDGFYKIPLKPEASPYINPEFSNIRILNKNNQEVPYILGIDNRTKISSQFFPYRIEEKTILKDSCTIITFSNESKSVISNVTLIIKNAEIIKEATFEGSDDRQTWYALKHQFNIGYIDNPNGTSEIQIVDFPNSNYQYYRLIISDKTTAPLNVLGAGYYTSGSEETKYLTLPPPKLTQENDNVKKTSFIRVEFDTLQFIDKIAWVISGTPYYLREASLYTERARLNKKGEKEKYLEFLTGTQLNSRQQNVVFLQSVKTDNLILEIANEDSPALRIAGVAAYQLGRHLTAWLSNDSEYTLKFGIEEMPSPVYDIAYFRDSIPLNVLSLDAGPISEIRKISSDSRSTFFTTRVFIWAAIIVVILFLAFMSLRMVRETSTQQERR
jgi:hypothetical protein